MDIICPYYGLFLYVYFVLISVKVIEKIVFDHFIYILHIFFVLFVSEANKGDLAEIQNEGAPASIPQKQKTSKAERRAIQEAQRAAKAAAKEAGNYFFFSFLCSDI